MPRPEGLDAGETAGLRNGMSAAGSTALWYASRATGIVAMVVLTLVVVLGVVVAEKVRVPGLPRFAVIGLHRRVSLIAVTFLAVHVLTAVADSYVTIRLVAVLVPFTAGYEPLPVGLGAVALDLAIAVLVTSLLRARVGWRLWRLVHWLGYAAYPVAVVHGFTSAKDLRSGWLLLVTVVCVVAVAGAADRRLAAGRRHGGQRQRPASRSAWVAGTVPGSAADHVPGDIGGRGAGRRNGDGALVDQRRDQRRVGAVDVVPVVDAVGRGAPGARE